MGIKKCQRQFRNLRLTRQFHFRYMGLWVLLTLILLLTLVVLLWTVVTDRWGCTLAGGALSPEDTLVREAWGILVIMAMSVFAIAIVGLAVVTAHRIAGPFIRLLETFETIRKGNLDVRLTFRREDRLDELARSFNAMMDGLSERGKARAPQQQGHAE